MGKKGFPKTGDQQTPSSTQTNTPLAQANNTVTPPVTTPTTPAATGFKMPTTKQWLNLAVSSIFPGLLYWILTSILLHHGVNFLLSHLLGYGLALMLLAYIQSVFKSGSELAKPIQIILTFILILCLSLHYLPDYGKKDNSQAKINKMQSMRSEILTFTGTEQLLSNKSFPQGKEVRLTVHGAPINMITSAGSQELVKEYGTYVFRFNSDGTLIFKGSGLESSITIQW